MARALLLIDIQNDYFPGGAVPLHEMEAAAAQAARLLSHFRARGEPVITCNIFRCGRARLFSFRAHRAPSIIRWSNLSRQSR